jgi:hypothetical protein
MFRGVTSLVKLRCSSRMHASTDSVRRLRANRTGKLLQGKYYGYCFHFSPSSQVHHSWPSSFPIALIHDGHVRQSSSAGSEKEPDLRSPRPYHYPAATAPMLEIPLWSNLVANRLSAPV